MFGEKLAALRKGKGMTQEALAEVLGVSRQSVSKWESDAAYPETEKLIALAKLYGVSTDELLTARLNAERYGENADGEESGKSGRAKKKFPLAEIFKVANIVLIFVPLVVTMIFLPFFPEKIPAHYAAGEITRWGSKYENLIFPGMIIVIGILFHFGIRLLAREAGKQGDAKNAVILERTLQIILSATLLLFNVLAIYFLIKGYALSVAEYGAPAIDKIQTACLCASLALAILGAVLPFTPKNPIFGIRTAYTMSSAANWRKVHRCGGPTLALAALAAAVTNLFLSAGLTNLYITAPIILAAFILIFAEHYLIKRNSTAEIKGDKKEAEKY